MKKMRPLKTGGWSLCSCPDELVGKGRCRHMLGVAQIVFDDEADKMKLVNVEGMDISGNSKAIQDCLDKIPEIDEEKKIKLLDYFNNLTF